MWVIRQRGVDPVSPPRGPGRCCGILADGDYPARTRLRRLLHAFFQSECGEAEIGLKLGDMAPLYCNAPRAAAAREGEAIMRTFITEALPQADEQRRRRATNLIKVTSMQIGISFSELPRTTADIAACADEMADMLDAYLAKRALPAL